MENVTTPLLWLLISVTLYLLGAQLARVPMLRRPARWLALRRLWEALYYLGLPYAALLQGDLLPRWMGLSGVQWVRDIGWGVVLGVGSLAVLVLLLRYVLGYGASIRPPASSSQSWAETAWCALRWQVHWAFSRALLIQVLGDLYWGTMAGVLMMLLELALDPGFREQWRDVRRAPQVAIRLMLLFFSAVQYLFVRNLLVLIVWHAVAERTLRPYGRQDASTLSAGVSG